MSQYLEDRVAELERQIEELKAGATVIHHYHYGSPQCQHEYPMYWGGTHYASCKKCGQSQPSGYISGGLTLTGFTNVAAGLY